MGPMCVRCQYAFCASSKILVQPIAFLYCATRVIYARDTRNALTCFGAALRILEIKIF